MNKLLVRYSPEVERDDPDFDKPLQTVFEVVKQQMKASFKGKGTGRVVRDAHSSGYRGEVELLKGLLDAYPQGIYAKPGGPTGSWGPESASG